MFQEIRRVNTVTPKVVMVSSAAVASCLLLAFAALTIGTSSESSNKLPVLKEDAPSSIMASTAPAALTESKPETENEIILQTTAQAPVRMNITRTTTTAPPKHPETTSAKPARPTPAVTSVKPVIPKQETTSKKPAHPIAQDTSAIPVDPEATTVKPIPAKTVVPIEIRNDEDKQGLLIIDRDDGESPTAIPEASNDIAQDHQSPEDSNDPSEAVEDNEEEPAAEPEQLLEPRVANLTVKISGQGRVRPAVLTSRAGRDYYAFYQIPYAKPPVGDLRFQIPQRPRRWRGTRDATVPGPQCIQREKYAPSDMASGDEDCLILNVYTPRLPPTGLLSRLRRRSKPKLPVMFYLHGGEPNGNGTRYGAKYFMDEDVVLVTIEHRMGFLASFNIPGDRNYPGNLGRRDQIAALEWVQRNIDKFGGDPDRVTIFGNSGGGMAVHLLMMSPMAEGLFHRAIMQSGSLINKGFSTSDNSETLNAFALDMGCNSTEAVQVLQCLQEVPASEIVLHPMNQANELVLIEQEPEDRFRRFRLRPRRTQAFITDTPFNLVTSGRVNKVPLILGINSREFTSNSMNILLNPNATAFANSNFSEIFTTLLKIQDTPDKSISKEFYNVYFGNASISNETRTNLMDLESDSFVFPHRLSGYLHANTTGEPVYFAYIDKIPEKSYTQNTLHKNFPPPYGVSHADELQYLFNYYGYPEIAMDSGWYNISRDMISMWTSFAAEGTPKTPASSPVPWDPIKLEDRGMKWFQIADEYKVVEPFTERMELWDRYWDQVVG